MLPEVVPPTPPSGYVVPHAAILVSNSMELVAALSKHANADIVLADGTYDHRTYFSTSSNRLWAKHLGGATMNAGMSMGGNWGAGGGELHGLRFDVSSPDKVLDANNAIVAVWGPAGVNTKVQDCTFRGNWLVGHGLYVTENSGLVAERLEFYQFTDTGLRASDNHNVAYGKPTARIKHISDIYVDGVRRPTPGGSNGTGEAGVWIGHPVVDGVQRIKVRNSSWSGIETVNNSWDTHFSDLDIDMKGPHVSAGIGLALEHFAYFNVYRNFTIAGAPAVTCEWDDPAWGGISACHHVIFERGLVDAAGFPGRTSGFYLDQGSESTTIRNVTFRNQSWAGIAAYKNVGTNRFTGNDFSALLPGAVTVSRDHY